MFVPNVEIAIRGIFHTIQSSSHPHFYCLRGLSQINWNSLSVGFFITRVASFDKKIAQFVIRRNIDVQNLKNKVQVVQP